VLRLLDLVYDFGLDEAKAVFAGWPAGRRRGRPGRRLHRRRLRWLCGAYACVKE
jgi:hypothetical protein